ncbi:MAG: hypothetical protein WCF67_17370 [Chitinophagaceae bacterium]
MRISMLFILMIFSFSALSQDTTRRFYPTGELRAWQIKIDSNLVFEKSFYKSGKVEGELYGYLTGGKPLVKSLKAYYETGEPREVMNDTLQIRYEPDGSIFQTTQYKNFKKHGISRTYLNKKLWLEMEFANGLQNGWMKSYDGSGKIVTMQQLYRDGMQDGPAKHYNSTGRLIKIIYYKNMCPYKAEYYDGKGKLTDTVTDKKAIWLKEGKPPGCS